MTYEINEINETNAGVPSLGDLLGAAAAQAVPVVRAIPDAALAHPTPCAEYDVKALVNHLFHVVVEFRELAAKKPADFTSTPDRVGAGDDWRDRFAEASGSAGRGLVAAGGRGRARRGPWSCLRGRSAAWCCSI